MRILGIDPGSVASGYAVLEITGQKARLVVTGVLKPQRGHTLAARLAEIGTSLESLVKVHTPDEAAVEDIFHSVNAKSSLRLAHARGVILSVLARAGIRIAEYTPVQVKKAVSGYGHADKDSLRALLVRLVDAPGGIFSRDASDAAAIALCHAQVVPFRDAVAVAVGVEETICSPPKRRPGSLGRR